MQKLFSITEEGSKTVDQALNSKFKDFEDGLQYYSALNKKVDMLVTRNKKDYIESEIPIVSPKEAIALTMKLQN